MKPLNGSCPEYMRKGNATSERREINQLCPTD